jgi:hypothetical protein
MLAFPMQAFVENIFWRDTRLARDSTASVACLKLALKAKAIESLKLCVSNLAAGGDTL